MRNNRAKQIALGGMLAALAVIIMCLGGFISIATYVCPMLCCMTQLVVLRFCGKRLAWTWFVIVSILALLLSPDKEAAMVFLSIGYYPLIKAYFDKNRIAVLLKFLYFNVSVFLSYLVMIYLMGIQDVVSKNMELGVGGLVVILVLGNITFLLLDRLLDIMARKLR